MSGSRPKDRSTTWGSQLPLAARMAARWNGFYALHLYHPVGALARAARDFGRALRGKARANGTRLPRVAWSSVFGRGAPFLIELRKAGGNVTVAELAILARAAAEVAPASEIVEIGTFDGRTTVNLALNGPSTTTTFTLDLPPDHPTRFQLAAGEEQYVDKPSPGARFRECAPPFAAAARRIVQLFGDSGTFDWSDYEGKAELVFVDGSHAYDYVRADSVTAMRLVAANGTVLWHDYGVWEGVTQALEELERTKNLGLRHIRGTSLVVWRPASSDRFPEARSGA